MTHACTGTAVNLDELLANKEARVRRQREWLQRHSLPLISFSINIPGPTKLTPSALKVFAQGMDAIHAACVQHGCTIVARQLLTQNTGPEAMLVIEGVSALELKKIMIDIESSHALGRLMDLDVIGRDGNIISRQGQHMPRRQCLVCDEDAVLCARSRRHSLAQLLAHIDAMVQNDECGR